MKNLICIFFLLLLSYNFEIFAQGGLQIDTITSKCFNSFTNQYQTTTNYRISNNSSDTYLTWVSLFPITNKSNIDLIQDYFLVRKGDYNFIEMMFENSCNETPMSIGYSFIKRITAGESFSYLIVTTNFNSKLYQDRIVIMRENDVYQYLKISVNESCFFPLKYIILLDN